MERTTNHDVKAIEYVLKRHFAADSQLAQASIFKAAQLHAALLWLSASVLTLLCRLAAILDDLLSSPVNQQEVHRSWVLVIVMAACCF